MSIIIIIIIIFLCTVNGKGEWSLHDLEVGEVQNLHKISNVGGCQLREKLARGGNWAMFRFKAVFRAGAMRGSIIIIMINDQWSLLLQHVQVSSHRSWSFQRLYTITSNHHSIHSIHAPFLGAWTFLECMDFAIEGGRMKLVVNSKYELIVNSKYFHHRFMIITRDHS